MANLTISGGVWTPGSHRHHHSGTGGEHFDPTNLPMASGRVHSDALEHEDGKTFLFWSWSGATETNTSMDRSVWVTYPSGPQSATLTRWYLRDSDLQGSGPGVFFDAFSLESGDFLDWGDDFDPFTVARGARNDEFASSASSDVLVTAEQIWPGGGPLLFTGWLVLRGSAIGHGNELSEVQGGSAYAIATYATPNNLERPIIERIPPFIYTSGDASLITRELSQLGNINELALALADAQGRAAIQTSVMRYLVDVGQAQLKQLSSGAGAS